MNVCYYCKTEFVPDIRHPNSKTCGSAKCKQSYKNEWGRLNPECKLNWIKRNPEKRAESSEKYRKKNSEYYAHYSSKRKRTEKQAMPSWAKLDSILVFYKEAKAQGLEVDHIIPLKHKKVCGLHNEFNLQLLSRTENAKKNNKFNEDIVVVISKEGVL